MSLFFSTERDDALLAMVVQEAHSAAGVSYLGRTALQKTMYFLKVLGVPMDYRFDIHHYGPFCNAILHDTEMLIVDGVVVDGAAKSRYSNYAPGPNAEELIEKHAAVLARYRQTVREVVAALAPMSPEKLELLATLHFAFAAEKASGSQGPWKERVLRRFREFKRDKFSPAEVGNGYEVLVKAGLATE